MQGERDWPLQLLPAYFTLCCGPVWAGPVQLAHQR